MTQVPVTKFYFSLLQQTGKKRRLFPVLKLPKICSFFSVTMHVWHGSLLFDQYISHGLNMLLTIIWQACSFIATRVGVIVETSSTESNSRVACVAFVFLVANDTDSCFGLLMVDTNHIESLLCYRRTGEKLAGQSTSSTYHDPGTCSCSDCLR